MDSPISTAKLELYDEGFILSCPGLEDKTVEWALVREIVAYRRDPDGLDLVCLGFRVSAFNDYIEINEEMENYGAILQVMYDKCTGISHHWWHEIAGVYGTNRMTIYGLPVSEQQKPSAAEQYLMRSKSRKRPTGKRLKHLLVRVIILAIVAMVQVLISWAIARWESTSLDDYLCMITVPILLTIFAARVWPVPRTFFTLLAGFYGFEYLFATLLHSTGPTLFGEFFHGELGWLILVGIEILLGITIMLLPDKHAAGRPVK